MFVHLAQIHPKDLWNEIKILGELDDNQQA
jgi:hypothetical protein